MVLEGAWVCDCGGLGLLYVCFVGFCLWCVSFCFLGFGFGLGFLFCGWSLFGFACVSCVCLCWLFIFDRR